MSVVWERQQWLLEEIEIILDDLHSVYQGEGYSVEESAPAPVKAAYDHLRDLLKRRKTSI